MLDMWWGFLIIFCVMLTENIVTLVQCIKDNKISFIVPCMATYLSICMIITSIIQICNLS